MPRLLTLTGVVQDRGTICWSVEAINAGRVWIPGAAEADPAALPAALAALLLFQPPE